MGNTKTEDLILKFQRSGAQDKANWLSSIDRRIPPSFKSRIVKNDKTILRELILPSWVSWDLLRDWALEDENETVCTVCGETKKEFVNVRAATICTDCIREIKRLPTAQEAPAEVEPDSTPLE